MEIFRDVPTHINAWVVLLRREMSSADMNKRERLEEFKSKESILN